MRMRGLTWAATFSSFFYIFYSLHPEKRINPRYHTKTDNVLIYHLLITAYP
jgi:hypothetical protein